MDAPAPLDPSPPPEPPAPPAPQIVERAEPRWSLPLRVVFRFFFVYELLFNLPFPLGSRLGNAGLFRTFSWVLWLNLAWSRAWDQVVPWVGSQVLHLSLDLGNSNHSSGDRLSDWVQLFTIAAAAAGLALLWSALDRRSKRYPRLHDALRLYLRLVVSVSMLSYGFMKVFRGQFPYPQLPYLMMPVGHLSPMAMLWTQIGSSTPYVVFAGTAEVVGGLLILFRRTTTLGALVVMGVMTHVFTLNLCFDVPVKIYSGNLLLMALLLLAPEARRLADLVVWNRPTAPRETALSETLLGDRPRLQRYRWIPQVLFLGYALYSFCRFGLEDFAERYQPPPPEPAPFGTWEVEGIERDHQPVTLQPDAPPRWQWISLGQSGPYGYLSAMDQHDSPHLYGLEVHPVQRLLGLVDIDPGRGVVPAGRFTWTIVDERHMTLDGALAGQATTLHLRKVERSDFVLESRGFHWVNEHPFGDPRLLLGQPAPR
jgi:uncharacterized membrane protein YphA (DoxX/SURF4 family)